MSSLLQKSTYIRPDFYLDLFLRKSGGFFAGGVIVISFNNETFFALNSFHSKKKACCSFFGKKTIGHMTDKVLSKLLNLWYQVLVAKNKKFQKLT